jgi:uncharacterized phage infection (PIP) family protein YhgE
MPASTAGILGVGAWFAQLVGPVLDQFANPNLGPALALGILIVGIATAAYIFVRMLLIRWRLARLEKVVRAIPDASAFGQRFDEVATALAADRLTAHGWSELRDSFVWPTREGDPIANTARPGRYLNRQEAGLHFRRAQSLPNLFVGIGLLFTFIGLVAALKAASGGIAGGDVAAITGSLSKLLGAATAKFYTSIAGLGCSIVLGFVIRDGLARIDRGFARIAAALEERLLAATPESLASRLLEEAREQTGQLKLINTDIAVAIGRQLRDVLDETLPRHLLAAASPLTASVSAMIEAISSQSRDGVGEMINAFGERLEGATQGRMGELAETLAGLTTALDGTARRMNQGGDDLGEALRGAAGQLAATVDAVRDTVSGLAQRMQAEGEADRARLGDQLSQVEHAMASIAARLVDAVEDGATRARDGAGDATAALVGRVTEAAERLGAVSAGIEAAVSRASEHAQAAVRETAEGTARQLGAAGAEAVAELRSGVDALGIRLGALADELARTTEGLREVESRLAGHSQAIGEAEAGTRAVAGALGETAIGIKRAAGDAGDDLRGATQPLLQVSERLAQATESARRSNESLERVLTQTAEQTRRQTEASEKALDQLQTVWERHVGRFDVVDHQLGDAFNEIGMKLRENLGHLAKFSTEIDSHTTNAVSHFAGAIEELAGIAEEISKGVQAMNGHGPGRRP